jgi:glycosyltransferase involved in cell wall biosynthesis
MQDILFVHINFPGQFVHLARALARSGAWRVFAIGGETARAPVGVVMESYVVNAAGLDGLDPAVRRTAMEHRRALAVAAACRRLGEQGCRPAVIVGHAGWGEMLCLRDVFPGARIVSYLEFFFSFTGADVNFDPEFPTSGPEAMARIRSRNAPALFAAADSDVLVTPTGWQASRFPGSIRDRIRILHEGVDTRRAAPDPAVRLDVDDIVLSPQDEVLTFVARSLEPYRGFHVFIRALPAILAARPRCRVLVIGGEGSSYGPAPPKGRSWSSVFLDEVGDRIDLSRVHFLGKLNYGAFLAAMQVSSVHAYLTYPFVLSWSLLEAMACGALVVGSRTAPVEEVIQHGENGFLVDFFDTDALAGQVSDLLAARDEQAAVRRRARQTVVDRYDLETVCLPAWVSLVSGITRGRPAAPAPSSIAV